MCRQFICELSYTQASFFCLSLAYTVVKMETFAADGTNQRLDSKCSGTHGDKEAIIDKLFKCTHDPQRSFNVLHWEENLWEMRLWERDVMSHMNSIPIQGFSTFFQPSNLLPTRLAPTNPDFPPVAPISSLAPSVVPCLPIYMTFACDPLGTSWGYSMVWLRHCSRSPMPGQRKSSMSWACALHTRNLHRIPSTTCDLPYTIRNDSEYC